MLEELWENTINNLWFQLALLLALAMASSMIFRRLGFSKVVGQIALGIIIGPSLLGLVIVEEGDTGDLITLFAPFGAIIMLFMIGLECDIKEIYTRNNILIAIGGISLPWVAGYVLAWLMLPEPSNPDMDRFSQSMFVGTALVATSVAITAGVLREMGIIGTSVAKTILGAAVVDDILGMVVLAITAGVATGTGLEMVDLVLIILAAVLFVGLGSYIGMRFIVRVIGRVERWGMARGMKESGFLLALSFAFVYAFMSELIGISAIVGAFIAGTSFSACEYRKQFMEGITFLEWVFAPIFFLSLGILVDINIPAELWMFAIALAAVAMLSKLLGGGIPAWLTGMNRRDSVSVGLGMAARLEVAMIIALYGLTAEIIDTQIYSAIIIMGVISVLVAPTLLRITVRHVGESEDNSLAPTCEIPRGKG